MSGLSPAVRLRLARVAESSRRHAAEQRKLDAQYLAAAQAEAASAPLFPRPAHRVPAWVLAHHDAMAVACGMLAEGSTVEEAQAWAREVMKAHGEPYDRWCAEMIANTVVRIERDLRRGRREDSEVAA